MKSLADQILDGTVEEGLKHIDADDITKGKKFWVVFAPESKDAELEDIKWETDLSGLLDYWLGAHKTGARPRIILLTGSISKANSAASVALKEYGE